MTKRLSILTAVFFLGAMVLSGCGKSQASVSIWSVNSAAATVAEELLANSAVFQKDPTYGVTFLAHSCNRISRDIDTLGVSANAKNVLLSAIVQYQTACQVVVAPNPGGPLDSKAAARDADRSVRLFEEVVVSGQ